jgi:hypothetical protein
MAAKAIAAVLKVAAGVAFVLAGTIAAGMAKSPPDSSRRVCKSLLPAGSHIPKRLCLTRTEWDEAARRAQDSLFKQQVDGMVKPVPTASSPGVDFPKSN